MYAEPHLRLVSHGVTGAVLDDVLLKRHRRRIRASDVGFSPRSRPRARYQDVLLESAVDVRSDQVDPVHDASAIDSATGVGAKNRKPVLMFHFASPPPAKSTPKSHESLASRGSGSNPTLISVSTSTTGRRLSRSIARISRPMSCFVHRYSPRWNTLQASPHRCFTRSHRSSDEARATNSIFECARSVVAVIQHT